MLYLKPPTDFSLKSQHGPEVFVPGKYLKAAPALCDHLNHAVVHTIQ